jgi:hypothetical protein
MKLFMAWLMLLLLMPGALAAAETAATRTSVSLGFSALDFDYEEFPEDETRANREEGLIPGAVAGAVISRGRWFAETGIAGWSGEVDYSGPIDTDTDEDIVDWRLLAGREIFRRDKTGIGLYGGFGYRYWERDIQAPGPGFSNLFETYDWWYGLLGVRGEYRFNTAIRLQADFSLTRTIEPQIEVEFPVLYDDITLDLGEKTGQRLSLLLERQVDAGLSLWVSPWYEVWKLGRSAEKVLQQGGVNTNATVYEPRSETENFGFNIGVTWRLQ